MHINIMFETGCNVDTVWRDKRDLWVVKVVIQKGENGNERHEKSKKKKRGNEERQ